MTSQSILVDTCIFVEFFRGKKDENLEFLIVNNQVLLSQIVYLEILRGVRKAEYKFINKTLQYLKLLPQFADSKVSRELLIKLKGKGLSLGIPDLLIIADSLTNKASLYTNDTELLAAAKIAGVAVL